MNDRVDKIVSALSRSDRITLIPVARLRVLNPRTRNPYSFSQLVENIASVGLKRPITVVHGGRDAEGEWHEVLCGQGCLEALKALGETMIPCSIVEASEIDRYLITLTENIARRRHSTAELLNGLQVLRAKGYTTVEIARKTNLDDTYINGILQLLEKDEQRLIQVVERRVMPLWLAIEDASGVAKMGEGWKTSSLVTRMSIVDPERSHAQLSGEGSFRECGGHWPNMRRAEERR